MHTATDPYETHITAVRGCTRCPTVVGPPVVGPAPGARIMLIGQAPGPREGEIGHPFAWTAGKTLFGWFAGAGVDEHRFRQHIHMCAVVRCFPGRSPQGGDRVPSRREILECFPFVEREITLLRPQLLLPVGRLAINRFLVARTLDEVIGRRYDGRVGDVPLSVIPLPHPSGRSTWIQAPANRRRLEHAIRLVIEHPAWQTAFARSEDRDPRGNR